MFFENKKIPLSKDTKSFSHLLKKNESTKEYIVEVTKSIYFCDNENDNPRKSMYFNRKFKSGITEFKFGEDEKEVKNEV